MLAPIGVSFASQIATALLDSGTEVKEVSGPKSIAEAVVREMNVKVGDNGNYRLAITSDLYVLTDLSIKPSPGPWRSCGEPDRDLLIQWISDYSLEALGQQMHKVDTLSMHSLLQIGSICLQPMEYLCLQDADLSSITTFHARSKLKWCAL